MCTHWSARGTSAFHPLLTQTKCCALWQVNGILEAFVHASASPRQLVHINVALVAFAAAHMTLSVFLVRAGGALGASSLGLPVWSDKAAHVKCLWMQRPSMAVPHKAFVRCAHGAECLAGPGGLRPACISSRYRSCTRK